MSVDQTTLSLYVHIPFCTSPCFYCGCNRVITRDVSKGERYLERRDSGHRNSGDADGPISSADRCRLLRPLPPATAGERAGALLPRNVVSGYALHHDDTGCGVRDGHVIVTVDFVHGHVQGPARRKPHEELDALRTRQLNQIVV